MIAIGCNTTIDPSAFPEFTTELVAILADLGMQLDPTGTTTVLWQHLDQIAPNATRAVTAAVWRMVEQHQREADAKRSVEQGQAAARNLMAQRQLRQRAA